MRWFADYFLPFLPLSLIRSLKVSLFPPFFTLITLGGVFSLTPILLKHCTFLVKVASCPYFFSLLLMFRRRPFRRLFFRFSCQITGNQRDDATFFFWSFGIMQSCYFVFCPPFPPPPPPGGGPSPSFSPSVFYCTVNDDDESCSFFCRHSDTVRGERNHLQPARLFCDWISSDSFFPPISLFLPPLVKALFPSFRLFSLSVFPYYRTNSSCAVPMVVRVIPVFFPFLPKHMSAQGFFHLLLFPFLSEELPFPPSLFSTIIFGKVSLLFWGLLQRCFSSFFFFSLSCWENSSPPPPSVFSPCDWRIGPGLFSLPSHFEAWLSGYSFSPDGRGEVIAAVSFLMTN